MCNGIPLRRLAVQYDYTQMWYVHNVRYIMRNVIFCYVASKKKQTKKNNNLLDFVLPRMIGYGMFGV